ncbi:MAG: hypothetical protein M5U21_01430 [Fimbriimonadaceae bacterium]|nr:hypothetical protein [Fimbriimonadaceae bacterium]
MGSKLWITEQTAEKVAVHDALDEAVHSRVESRECRQPIRCPPRDHQVGLRVELVSPEPSRSEWLILHIFAKVMMEATGKDEHPGRSPAKRHDGHQLMGRVVNPAHEDTAAEDNGFSSALYLIELARRVVWPAMSRLDGRELRSKESGITVEPKTGWLIEAGLRIEGSSSGWGCKVRFHPPTVSTNCDGD